VAARQQFAALFATCAIAASLGALTCVSARAEVKLERLDYKKGDMIFKGFIAYDDALQGKRPAILVSPTWTGPGEYVQGRAKMFAAMGYVALVQDVYGNGAQPARGKEAATQMNIYMKDRALLRERMRSAFDILRANSRVDDGKVIAVGYCFGGTGVLELARSGANLAGIVVFHGILDTPTPQDAKNIKAPILVLNGEDDPNVPPASVAGFLSEMKAANVDLQFVNYSGTKHGFTDPASGNNPKAGSVYNAKSDKRSWLAMQDFLHEIIDKQ
jgi:dienelactone hydrolase